MVKEEIDYKVPANRLQYIISTAYRAGLNVYIEGETGISKSSQIKQAATTLETQYREKFAVISFNCYSYDPQELLGIPYRDENNRLSYSIPSFLPIEGRGIINFEEVNRSHPQVQTAVMSLANERCIVESGYRLPDGFIVVCSVNPAGITESGKKYHVNDCCPAMRGRFLTIKCTFPSSNSWIEWGSLHNINPLVRGFAAIHSQNEFFTAASPRGWEMVSKILNTLTDEEKRDERILNDFLHDMLPKRWIDLLLKYTQGIMTAMIEPESILTDFHKSVILKKQIKKYIAIGAIDCLVSIIDRVVDLISSSDLVALNGKGMFNMLSLDLFIEMCPGDLKERVQYAFANNVSSNAFVGIEVDSLLEGKNIRDAKMILIEIKSNKVNYLHRAMALSNAIMRKLASPDIEKIIIKRKSLHPVLVILSEILGIEYGRDLFEFIRKNLITIKDNQTL